MDSLYEILNANKILGLVSDQDARGRGVFVDFFRCANKGLASLIPSFGLFVGGMLWPLGL